MHIIVD